MAIKDLISRELNRSYQHKPQWKGCITAYENLTARQQNLADEGIERHFIASERINVHPDFSAVREIIMDASTNRQVWKESNKEFISKLSTESKTEFKRRLELPAFV